MMGRLAELLSQPTAPEVTTTFDESGKTYSQSLVLDRQPATANELLDLFGHDPARFAVDGQVTVSHRELVDGRTMSSYRYKLVEKAAPVDLDDIERRVRKAKPHKEVGNHSGGYWFVFQAGDLQLGKRSSAGSTEEIVERFYESAEAAVAELLALGKRHPIAGIQLSFPGDCIEGIVSQGGKNQWLTQETVTEQNRIFRRLLLDTVQRFACYTDDLVVTVVNGNHDQSQRQQGTYPGDGWATECAIAVDDALKLNPGAFGHVRVLVPDKWDGYLTVELGDSVVTVVHGHQFGAKSSNGMRWWQEQTFGGHHPGRASVLQNGHFHEVALEQSGDRTRVQSPTFDCGSDWYRELHGVGNARGALVYLLRSGAISRMSVV